MHKNENSDLSAFGGIHHGTTMMDTIIKLREKYNLHMKVERYISNDEIPETDKKFIKE